MARHYRSERPLDPFRAGVLSRAGWAPAPSEAPWTLFVPTQGRGLEDRLATISPPEGARLAALPGGTWLCNKRRLWIALVRHLDTGAAGVMPQTWLPEIAGDRDRLAAYIAAHPGAPLILKDTTRQRREGVQLVEDPRSLDLDALGAGAPGAHLLQRPVPDLLELAGRRFGIRVWVVVHRTGGRLRAAVHPDGLLVYAAETGTPSDRWITRPSAVPLPGDLPATRSALSDALAGAGVPPSRLDAALHTPLARCIDATIGQLAAAPHPDTACAELFGVDLVLDHHLRAWVLEWNRMPRVTPRHSGEAALRVAVLSGALAAAGVPGFVEDVPWTMIFDRPLPP